MLAMSELCIFCDAPLSNSALQLLMQGVAAHELVFPNAQPDRFSRARSLIRH